MLNQYYQEVYHSECFVVHLQDYRMLCFITPTIQRKTTSQTDSLICIEQRNPTARDTLEISVYICGTEITLVFCRVSVPTYTGHRGVVTLIENLPPGQKLKHLYSKRVCGISGCIVCGSVLGLFG